LGGAINLGVAAHITAASRNGPRYDALLTEAERRNGENGIWLCQNCAKLIDNDSIRYSVKLLQDWKIRAEQFARLSISAPSPYRSIKPTEIHQELEIWEQALYKALEDEFGCAIQKPLQVDSGEGWLNLDGGVARGEDLIVISAHRDRGNGIAVFQIEHIIDLLAQQPLAHFRKAELYIAVVSSNDDVEDIELRSRLQALADNAGFEVVIRVFRLRELRARYAL
jgi:hypothetical protein